VLPLVNILRRGRDQGRERHAQSAADARIDALRQGLSQLARVARA
jgi:hypothetical protein